MNMSNMEAYQVAVKRRHTDAAANARVETTLIISSHKASDCLMAVETELWREFDRIQGESSQRALTAHVAAVNALRDVIGRLEKLGM